MKNGWGENPEGFITDKNAALQYFSQRLGPLARRSAIHLALLTSQQDGLCFHKNRSPHSSLMGAAVLHNRR